MGERHDAEREIAQARERLSEIAEELSRRASGPYVKARAREIADEMSVRAKVKARERTLEMRDKVLDSPWALGLIGGAVGAIAGKVIGEVTKRARGDGRVSGWDERYLMEERPYDEYTATHAPHLEVESEIITEGASYGARHEGEIGRVGFQGDIHTEEEQGLRGKAKEKLGELKHRASELSESAQEKARGAKGAVRERAHAMREHLPERSQHSREQLRSKGRAMVRSTEEHSSLYAAGAFIVGAIFGSVVPVSEKERMMLRPAKEQVKEGIASAKDEAIATAQNIKENVQQSLSHEEEEAPSTTSSYSAGSESAGVYANAEEETDVRYGEHDASGLQSGMGTFSAGEVSEGGTLEQKREENREGGTWTPQYDPDVTRH